MRVSSHAPQVWATFAVLASLIVVQGCSRSKYRLQADREAYCTIAERNVDPRWCAADYSVELDPRSRYFDPYNPDCSPMPLDDPASHQYMQEVDGMKGWPHWYDNGSRFDLENPTWHVALANYVETEENGAVKLNVDTALELAYLHSPSHQSQLETLYLSALDVTEERFRLDTQFFGGYDARYAHNGSLIPAGLRYVPLLGRFEVAPAIDGDGVENNRWTYGRPFAADPAFQVKRRFATAGEVLVGFANSFILEFTGRDANLATSLANFSLVQPLLRGAGRDIALEQLTFVERNLLANLRSYSRFRQGFYTQIAIGDLGVSGLQRRGGSTSLQSFSGSSFVGGYTGLLQQLQRVRNSEDILSLQLRTLARLEAFEEVGVIDLVQVDQFRQNIERARSALLLERNRLELDLDRYKTTTLGLPPNLPIELDDSMIRQFQFVSREATATLDSISQLQALVGKLPDDASVELVQQVLSDSFDLIAPVQRQLESVPQDFAYMEEKVPAREQSMTEEEKIEFRLDRERLASNFAEEEQNLRLAVAELEALQAGFTEQNRTESVRELVVWLGDLLRLVERAVLIQARARLEAVSIETFDLEAEKAFEIAINNRLDFMNGRASLVDSWRLIQFNADALQSVVNLTASGEMRTARNNPVSFRAPTGNLRLGLEFDAPLTRLVERNDYRESLINYQRSRRAFIQSQDALHLGVRALLREIEQLRQNLEIQRRAVAIAIRRVDLTQTALSAPVPPPRPGQRAAQFNPTTAINLESAQSSLQTSQNLFLAAWLNYYAARMRLSRELGIMMLDQEGRWIDAPLPDAATSVPLVQGDLGPELLRLPPTVPREWVELANELPPPPNSRPPATLDSVLWPAGNQPSALLRLPPAEDPAATNRYNLLHSSN